MFVDRRVWDLWRTRAQKRFEGASNFAFWIFGISSSKWPANGQQMASKSTLEYSLSPPNCKGSNVFVTKAQDSKNVGRISLHAITSLQYSSLAVHRSSKNGKQRR
jgi:hypothetical protein